MQLLVDKLFRIVEGFLKMRIRWLFVVIIIILIICILIKVISVDG